MANPTAEILIGLARDLLREEGGSDVPVIGDSFMLSALSDANLKWADAFGVSGESPILFQRETGFDLATETAINDASGTTTATVTITVDDTTGYDSAGAAVIWDDNMPDVFTYTGLTATTFTGVSGLSFAHEDNDVVAPLESLPSNFSEFRETPIYGDGVSLNGLPLRYMNAPPMPGFFSIYDDGTTKFLWLPRQSTGSASVFYNKISSIIDSIDDTVDVPDTYKFFLVWHLVALAYIGREDDYQKMLLAQSQSERVLQRALTRRNTNKKIRTRPFSRNSRDYTSAPWLTLF